MEEAARLRNRDNNNPELHQSQGSSIESHHDNALEEYEAEHSTAAAQEWHPDFFAIGPARTATTWLHTVLEPHVNLPLTKETRFVDLHYRRGWRWYRTQFGTLRDRCLAGEVAPTYFHSNVVRARIKQHVPSAKIICTLRDPVERLYSLFRYLRFRGSFSWEFEEALSRDSEMVESARYGHYVKEWIRDFGRGNVLVTIYDDIEDDPQGYIDQVANFLKIRRFVMPSAHKARVNSSEQMRAPSNYRLARIAFTMSDLAIIFRAQSLFRLARGFGLRRLFHGNGLELPPLDPEFALSLRKRLTPEVAEVERLIGRDLSAWKA